MICPEQTQAERQGSIGMPLPGRQFGYIEGLQPRVVRGTVIFGVEVPIRSGKRIRRLWETILRGLNVLTVPPECAENVAIPSVLGEEKSHLSPPLPSVRHSELVCTLAARSSQHNTSALAATRRLRRQRRRGLYHHSGCKLPLR